jgi:signal transduction histidine kinase
MGSRQGQLKISKDKLRDLLARVEAAHEQEKAQFARTLHDDLSQKLTALLIELSLLETAFSPTTKEAKKIAVLSEMVSSISQSVRRLTNQLRLKILDEFGLFPAIRHETERWRKEAAVLFHLTPESLELDLDPEIGTQLFKSFQSIVSEMVAHRGVKEIHVSIQSGARALTLTVSEQSERKEKKGLFDVEPLGLMRLEEQVYRLQGTLKILHGPTGATVKIKVPLIKATKERSRSVHQAV